MTPVEHITIAHLAKLGRSVREIAQVIERDKDTVHANLRASRQLLEFHAPEFVQDWTVASRVASHRGDHRPAMDALERVRVIEKPKDETPAPFQINVGIALPGVPATPPVMTFEAQPAVNGHALPSPGDRPSHPVGTER